MGRTHRASRPCGEHEVHHARETSLGHGAGTGRAYQRGYVAALAQIILGHGVDLMIRGAPGANIDFGAAATTLPAGCRQNLLDCCR